MDKKTCPFCQKAIKQEAFKCKHCGAWFSDDAEVKQKALDKEEQAEKLLQQKKDKAGEVLGDNTECFSVSTKKLVLMSILTHGLYELYWYYRNWRAIMVQESKKISPFWRSVFSVFYCYTLFKRILLKAGQRGHKIRQSPGSLAVLYILFIIIGSKTPEPYDIIGIFSFIPIVYVNNAVRFNCKAINAQYQERRRLTKGEIIFLTIGILIWAAIILDLIYPA